MYGPVCTVVWEGEGCEAFPYPDFMNVPIFPSAAGGEVQEHGICGHLCVSRSETCVLIPSLRTLRLCVRDFAFDLICQ